MLQNPIACSTICLHLPALFDDDFTDSSGNGFDFDSAFGSVGFTTGKFGLATQINNGGLVSLNIIGFPTGGLPWTVALWAKPDPGQLGFNNRLFGFRDASGQWLVMLDPQGNLGVQAIGGPTRSPISPVSIFSNLQIPNDGSFHHVAVRWTGVGPGGVTSLLTEAQAKASTSLTSIGEAHFL